MAEKRLATYGLTGLNIVDVAADAGMSHATLIHHFGNTARMRRALASRMTNRIISDVVQTLQAQSRDNRGHVVESLFAAFAEGGQGKLMAWLAIGDTGLGVEDAEPPQHLVDLFTQLVPAVATYLPEQTDREERARQIVMLVATAAIGFGLSSDILGKVLGMDDESRASFPPWLGAVVRDVMDTVDDDVSADAMAADTAQTE